MAKMKVWQHRCYKYTNWPYTATCFYKMQEHGAVICWLLSTLKKSHYRVNYDRNMFKWYPNSVCMIDYHFKYEADCVAFKLKYPPSAAPSWPTK
jgi:hypothetical protein